MLKIYQKRRDVTHYYFSTGRMGTAFLVTFVDAIEAFLVVGVAVAFVRKTRQLALVSAVRWGIAASVLVSAGGAWWMAQAGNFARWERRFAVLAVLAIVGFATFMWRRRQLLIDTPGAAPVSTHLGGWAAVFLFTILVLAREGMHTLLLLAIFIVVPCHGRPQRRPRRSDHANSRRTGP